MDTSAIASSRARSASACAASASLAASTCRHSSAATASALATSSAAALAAARASVSFWAWDAATISAFSFAICAVRCARRGYAYEAWAEQMGVNVWV